MQRSADIRRVSAEGRRFRTANLEIRVLESAKGITRIAFVVPRYGRSVVRRNRVRRVLREHFRVACAQVVPSFDIVVRALPGAYATEAAVIRSELRDMMRRISERAS